MGRFKKWLAAGFVAALTFAAGEAAAQVAPILPQPGKEYAPVGSPVYQHGKLSVDGSHKIVGEDGSPVILRGMSFFWSNAADQAVWYNDNVVGWLVHDWKISVVRIAMGAWNEPAYSMGPGYAETSSRAAQLGRVRHIIEAAIRRGIYVVIDWHVHSMPDETVAGSDENLRTLWKEFFVQMADEYGAYPNIIYELYREPTSYVIGGINDWEPLMAAQETVINAIRTAENSKGYHNNIIVAGTPDYSSKPNGGDVIPDVTNVAYSMHFYATSNEYSSTTGKTNMTDALGSRAVFATEWWTTDFDGLNVNTGASEDLITLMEDSGVSWINWSVSNKNEPSSIFPSTISLASASWTPDNKPALTASGEYVRAAIRSRNEEYFGVGDPTYAVNTSVIGEGAIERSVNVPYTYGQQITLTAVPGPGQVFNHWSGDAVGTNPELNVRMVGVNLNITANFVRASLVTNGMFYPNTSGWTPQVTGGAQASLTVNASGGGLINVTATGTVTIRQQNIGLENGKRYKLSFDAYTLSGSRTVGANVGTNPNNSAYLNYPVDINTSQESFSQEFVMTGNTGNVFLWFSCGDQIGEWVLNNVRIDLIGNAPTPTIDLSAPDLPTIGIGWVYDPSTGVITVGDSANVTITGTSDSEKRIEIEEGASVNITFTDGSSGGVVINSGVDATIEFEGTSDNERYIEIAEGAKDVTIRASGAGPCQVLLNDNVEVTIIGSCRGEVAEGAKDVVITPISISDDDPVSVPPIFLPDDVEVTVKGPCRFELAENAKNVKVKLDNVTIDLSDWPSLSPFLLHNGAEVTVTLVGTNTLIAGSGRAGIEAPAGTKLVITGIGSLTVSGGANGAGIGGGNGGTGGDITISGGVVTAIGGTNAQGIGRGSGSGSAGTFAISGNAVVFTNSVGDAATSGRTGGLLFIDNTGTFYGASVTVSADVTIPEDYTLTVPANVTLTIAKDVTLTNKGTVINRGGTINHGGANYGVWKDNPYIDVKVPTADDLTFTIPKDHVYTGAARGIGTVTGATGMGVITVLYNGGATVPTNAGAYNVTVNAAEGELFFAAEGIELGEYVIAKKPVTIIGVTASNKVYDGNTVATITGTRVVSGKVGEDDVTAANGTASFANKNVGIDKTVTFTGFTLGGADAGNYALSAQPASVTADITAKPVTITGLTASNKDYDGTANATVTGTPVISGAVSGDVVTVVNGTASFADRNVGTGKTVTFTGFTLTGADAGNYNLTDQPASVTANITAIDTTAVSVLRDEVIAAAKAINIPVTIKDASKILLVSISYTAGNDWRLYIDIPNVPQTSGYFVVLPASGSPLSKRSAFQSVSAAAGALEFALSDFKNEAGQSISPVQAQGATGFSLVPVAGGAGASISVAEFDIIVKSDDYTAVLSSDRTIANVRPNEEAAVVAPVNSAAADGFTAGPNVVRRGDGAVKIFRHGNRVTSGTLTVYDATGNVVNKVSISDNPPVSTPSAQSPDNRREVGRWDLRDARGRLVGEGAYLLRGTVTTADGKRERVSVLVSVR